MVSINLTPPLTHWYLTKPLAENPFPAELMAAVMTSEMDNTDKIVGLYDECLRMGLKSYPTGY